jgi:hypothetical protein
LETTATNQNSSDEKTKDRQNSGNAYYHSVQNQLLFRFLSKTMNELKYKKGNPRVHGCETWSLTLREECSLLTFENRVLRVLGRISGPNRGEVTGGCGKLINKVRHYQGHKSRQIGTYGGSEMNTKFLSEKLKGRSLIVRETEGKKPP